MRKSCEAFALEFGDECFCHIHGISTTSMGRQENEQGLERNIPNVLAGPGRCSINVFEWMLWLNWDWIELRDFFPPLYFLGTWHHAWCNVGLSFIKSVNECMFTLRAVTVLWMYAEALLVYLREKILEVTVFIVSFPLWNHLYRVELCIVDFFF